MRLASSGTTGDLMVIVRVSSRGNSELQVISANLRVHIFWLSLLIKTYRLRSNP